MRRKSIFSIIMALLITMTIFVGNVPSYAKTEAKRQIVVFDDNISVNKKTEILDKHKAIKIKDIMGTNAVVVCISSDNSILDESDVRFVEEDYVISIEGSTSKKDKKDKKDKKADDQISEQPSEVIPWGVEYMNNITSDEVSNGAGIKVAIIDTGIDIDHPDLVDNIKGGYNSIIGKEKLYDDDNGHGTHVSGIIAAEDNDIGVVGVAPDAEIYAVKALDSTGNGYVSDVIEGIEWCIENDIDIVNLSIGMTMDSTTLHESVIKAYAMGIIMVAAAGNNYGGSCEYPAAYNEVVGVGAIDINGNVSAFSATESVDVWAPGQYIYSTYMFGAYETMSGTSMAAPHVIKEFIIQEFTN